MMWRVGYHANSLMLISLMSGLVEIHDVVWNSDEHVLVFVVSSTDKTDTLFKKGSLVANPVYQYKKSDQPMLVDFSSRGSQSSSAMR